MSTTRNPFQKVVLQPEAISASSLHLPIGALNGNLTTLSNKPNRWPEVQTNCIEIKEHDAFKTPISTLVDLWLTRFGNEWTDLEEIEKDEFFAIAYKRLKQMGELEQHYLTDRARYVCRKPE